MAARHKHPRFTKRIPYFTPTSDFDLDDDLVAEIMARTGPPDRNGCMLWNERGSRKAVQVVDATDDSLVMASVKRVVMAVFGGVDVGADEDVANACANNGHDGPLCVCLDHLFVEKRTDLRRRQSRTRHANLLKKTLRRTA